MIDIYPSLKLKEKTTKFHFLRKAIPAVRSLKDFKYKREKLVKSFVN